MRAETARRLRVALAVALTATVAVSLAPHAVSHFAASAVVTAPISVIRSPIEGRLAEAPGAPGRAVRAGERLALVEAREGADARLRALDAQVEALDGALAGVEDQIAAAQTRRDRFADEDAAVLGLQLRRLTAELDEALAEARGAAARADLAQADLEMTAALHARGAAPAQLLRAAQAEAAAADAAREAAEARAEQTRARRIAAERGFLLFDGGVDRTEAGRQRDYADARLDDLRRDRSRLTAELSAARRNREAERMALLDHGRFAPVSPVHGVIWAAPPPPGRPVLPGDVLAEVLDCRARFVEALVDVALAARIAPGDPAVIRVRGRETPLSAEVVAVAGAGAGRDAERLAAAPEGSGAGRLRVSLRLVEGTLGTDAARFCHVGLPAEVRFRRALPLGLRVAAASWTALAERAADAARGLATPAAPRLAAVPPGAGPR